MKMCFFLCMTLIVISGVYAMDNNNNNDNFKNNDDFNRINQYLLTLPGLDPSTREAILKNPELFCANSNIIIQQGQQVAEDKQREQDEKSEEQIKKMLQQMLELRNKQTQEKTVSKDNNNNKK